jgi:hypothetical protein
MKNERRKRTGFQFVMLAVQPILLLGNIIEIIREKQPIKSIRIRVA